jgi:hypothetical protein
MSSCVCLPDFTSMPSSAECGHAVFILCFRTHMLKPAASGQVIRASGSTVFIAMDGGDASAVPAAPPPVGLGRALHFHVVFPLSDGAAGAGTHGSPQVTVWRTTGNEPPGPPLVGPAADMARAAAMAAPDTVWEGEVGQVMLRELMHSGGATEENAVLPLLAASAASAAEAPAGGNEEHTGGAAPSSASAAAAADVPEATGGPKPPAKLSELRQQGDYHVVWQFRGGHHAEKGIAWYDYNEDMQIALEQHWRTKTGLLYHREPGPGQHLMEYNLQRMCQHDTETRALTMMRRCMLHSEEWLSLATTMRAYAEAEAYRAMLAAGSQSACCSPASTAESKKKRQRK